MDEENMNMNMKQNKTNGNRSALLPTADDTSRTMHRVARLLLAVEEVSSSRSACICSDSVILATGSMTRFMVNHRLHHDDAINNLHL